MGMDNAQNTVDYTTYHYTTYSSGKSQGHLKPTIQSYNKFTWPHTLKGKTKVEKSKNL